MPNKQGIIKSSGNVFEDVGLENPKEYLAKAELAHQINKLIQQRGLTQIEAAKLLGIDQPKISALSCGRLSGFSIERLFKYLIKLDQEIEIVIKPHKSNKKSIKNTPPSINVRYVDS
ncbi:MAG: XRE family transcriptional regulator [Proteobacteria bacterium]|nr:XRE family transcriptional regulator [Pseudomonadota bacterium]